MPLLRTTSGRLSKSFVPDRAAWQARIAAALSLRQARPVKVIARNHY